MKFAEYPPMMRDLPVSERPRERLLSKGPAALSDAELVAILLGTGSSRRSVLTLAMSLLKEKGLRGLAAMRVEEWQRQEGVGEAKAARLAAAFEIGKRLSAMRQEARTIRRPSDAAGLLMEEMRYLDRETFRAILLDTKNHILGIELISVGTLNSTLVHPREVFKGALARSAAAVLLVHNHPSGDPTASADDLELTRRLVRAGRLLGIEVLDHIIIGDNRFNSLREIEDIWSS